MAKGIMILGPAGAGKTTLGRLTAGELGVVFLDVDEYMRGKDPESPYTPVLPDSEKIRQLVRTVKASKEFVMAGALDTCHEKFDSMFRLAVYLTASERIRVERVHRQEVNKYGNRVLLGGDMYEAHQNYLHEVGRYDAGTGTGSSRQHEAWMRKLRCPILRLNGEDAAEQNADAVIEAYRKAK